MLHSPAPPPDCRRTMRSHFNLHRHFNLLSPPSSLTQQTVSLQTVSQMHCPSSRPLCQASGHSEKDRETRVSSLCATGSLCRPCVHGSFDTERGFEECATPEQGEMSSAMLFSHYGAEMAPVERNSWRASGLWDINTSNLQQA